jgi:uncharacterized protein YjbI with pentapeptide repeats
MANEEQLRILERGVKIWNRWREENAKVRPDLSGADLRGADLSGKYLFGTDLSEVDLREADLRKADLSGAYLTQANLSGAHLSGAHLSGAALDRADLSGAYLGGAYLSGANLSETDLSGAHLSGAKLSEAYLHEANLSGANLSGADLRGAKLSEAKLSEADLSEADLTEAYLTEAYLSGADLSGADLSGAELSGADLSKAELSGANLLGAHLRGARLIEANLSGANLSGANLISATLIQANFARADLTDCYVYGISAWKLNLEGANQSNLIISDYDELVITVDNLEVAQFIYLLLHNEKIRHIIDTITSKVVLILGRFTPERKAILDAIRDELRRRDYLPVLFDFEKPSSRDLTETISTLAHMARFVIADITDSKSIPAELERIVPGLPSVPVQPLLASSDEYALFEHIRRYQWVLEPYRYDTPENLLASLKEKVIDPAESKAKELTSPAGRPLVSAPPENLKAPTP